MEYILSIHINNGKQQQQKINKNKNGKNLETITQ